ncbi:MAG: hypothetical protein ACD_49C00075G0003 [uncultured bacterium (gcode 4)]|uniref:Uncharacterized protein n=1 Tax=uncultured bacterium (gcode 4) TaxID=1234023 RepID=K2AW31_9BACT|nr:MAG: hypothetical protein ACD_49C00075G0003 [uncultured bacterium (gcode 4)]
MQAIFILIYLVSLIFVEMLIEKRLNTLNYRHMQKIWWGYWSYWLFMLHKKLKIIIRILTVLLFLFWITIIIILF